MSARRSFLAGAVSLVPLVAGAAVARHAWIDEKMRAARGDGTREDDPPLPRLAPDSRPTVLLLGDSRISRWSLNDTDRPWKMYNRGVGGETVVQLARRFQRELAYFSPDQLVISSGINDAIGLSFMSPSDAKSGISRLVGTLIGMARQAADSNAHVVLTTILPPAKPSALRRLVWSQHTLDVVRKINDGLLSLRLPGNITLVDVMKTFTLDREGYLVQTFRDDALHLNAAGYALLEEAIFAGLGGETRRDLRLL